MVNKVPTGRPSKLDTRKKRKIINLVEKIPRITTTQISAEPHDHLGKEVHLRIFSRIFNLSERVACKKPYRL